MQTEQPVHDLVDFVALAATLTNEQKILGCLERIEALLIARAAPQSAPTAATQAKPSREEQIAALAAKTGTRRK